MRHRISSSFENNFEGNQQTNKRVIYVIELGGTISSIAKQATSEFYNETGDSVSCFFKEFDFESNIQIKHECVQHKISHDLSIEDLIDLGIRIQRFLDNNEIYSVVVTMGTNALEDVAYFIGLVVKTQKSIVFTGSHFPQNSLGFDGVKNLYNAILVASSKSAQGLGAFSNWEILVPFNIFSARPNWLLADWEPLISSRFVS